MKNDTDTIQIGNDKFLEHMYGQIDLINSLSRERKWLTLKKAAYVALIDSIGRIAFPKMAHRDNEKRFCTTILNFGKWPHGSYFSLTHLHQYLKTTRDINLATVRDQLVNPAYAPWLHERCSIDNLIPFIDPPFDHPRIVPIKADLPEDTVIALINDKATLKSVRKFQHYALLYAYRNYLVHTFTTPGIGDRPEILNYPYYEQYFVTDTNSGQTQIFYDLVYPSDFFNTLARRVLANASVQFRNSSINPYRLLKSTTAIFGDDALNTDLGLAGQMVETIRNHPRKW